MLNRHSIRNATVWVVGSVLIAAGTASTAAAQCKPLLSAQGGLFTVSLSTPGTATVSAKESAVRNWQRKAGEGYGPEFANWKLAQNNQISCQTIVVLRVRCTAIGQPCSKMRQLPSPAGQP